MVIFGDPVPLENPALTAVTTALEMRAAISALIERWRRLGHDLGFGVGIAHGYATLGRISSEGRFDYTAIGRVVNLAARLCGEAKSGQILVDGRVQAAIESLVEIESAGELTLKGFTRPVTAFDVRGLRG